MPRTVLELLNSWGAAIGCGHAKEAWRLAPLCLLWCIWREWNARLFDDVETSMVELRKRLLNTLYFWIAPHHSLSVFTYVDFLNLFSGRPFYRFSCILLVYKGCAPLRFLINCNYLLKKKKNSLAREFFKFCIYLALFPVMTILSTYTIKVLPFLE